MKEISFLRKVLSKNLKTYRKARNLSQEKLSEQSGLSVVAITNIETGKSFPQEETLEKLAHALNINPIDFFNITENPVENLNVKVKDLEAQISDINNSLKSLSVISLSELFDTSHSKPRL